MKPLLFILGCIFGLSLYAQDTYEPSEQYPFGRPNPDAPEQIKDWKELIGICDCISQSRNPDRSWAPEQKMSWEFKYIMNGNGVQDQTIKEDGSNSGSIRQFIADSTRWYVHYYSNKSPTTVLSAWEGNRKGDAIILYRKQKAPNGMDGFFKINFTDISENGFNWLGEWVNTAETFSYPTWKIRCTKRKNITAIAEDEAQIRATAAAFSAAYVAGDYKAIGAIYTIDGKIFPNNARIIQGQDAIAARFKLPEGVKALTHKTEAEDILIEGDTAYDHGYYSGSTQSADGTVSGFKGKYVIVWKKIGGKWKMYLDIWNRVKDD